MRRSLALYIGFILSLQQLQIQIVIVFFQLYCGYGKRIKTIIYIEIQETTYNSDGSANSTSNSISRGRIRRHLLREMVNFKQ